MSDYPRFNVSAVERVVTRLLLGPRKGAARGMAKRWAQVDLSNDAQGELAFANDMIKLSGYDIPLSAMRSTCAACGLFIAPINVPTLTYACWRIAANLSSLAAGQSISAWSVTDLPVQAPLQIIGAKTGWSKGNKPRSGTSLLFKVVAGRACPLFMAQWFPNKFLYVLARDLGVGNYRAKARYEGERVQLCGMRLLGILAESKYDRGITCLEKFIVGQFKGYNERLMKLRRTPCPDGYEWDCHRCSLGADKCSDAQRACRLTSLSLSFCRLCGKDTWHEGDDCVPCRRRPPRTRVMSNASSQTSGG